MARWNWGVQAGENRRGRTPSGASLAQTGAVLATWDENISLADQLEGLLADAQNSSGDQRDRLGQIRKGRPKAADIAERVHDLAVQSQ